MVANLRRSNRQDNPEVARRPNRVVAIASSMGGIEALITVVSALPTNFPAAILLVQHLSPKHKSY